MSASLMGWKWLPYFYFCLAISFCHLVWHLKEKGWFHSKATCMWGASYTFALCHLWSVTPAEKLSFKVQFSSPPFPLGEQEIPAGPGEHLAGCYPEFFHYIAIVKMSPCLAQPCRGKQTSSALLHQCQPESRLALISSPPSKQGSNLLPYTFYTDFPFEKLD